ncbi:phospholipase D-like domain-containing protein [Pedobacter helvus]|uniref:phospholipase D n=1 Tax=Pedobacter helvus TaxID=2563444 RepID=A0ABW9JIP3_9SPHI|nr:phospholipase D-like domain-containing protein [Pedobacter ureilyticus]
MSNLITNGTEIKQRIISEINNAKQCVYVAMAYFTDRDIAMAIVDAKNRNVSVDIILSSNAQNETVKLMLKGAGIKVHAFETGDVRGIMHHKFCLIDHKISINGSYNYSLNASTNNIENIQVSENSEVYNQFLSEFERLKYNIDHDIGVNEKTLIPESKVPEVQSINIIDVFSKRLHDLVYSAAQIDTAKYRQQGYENSTESKGSIDIFRTEYDNIKERIRTYATDEGLGNMKNVLTSNVSMAYEGTKTNLETEKLEKISIEKRSNELAKRQVADKISEIKQDKSILESGNQNTGEKGLLQINKEIEKNKLERKTLEQSFVVKKFWNLGTTLSSLFLVILSFYLSFFFASAVYKVLFEYNVIQNSMEAGVRPGLPELFDANAIVKIFRQKGAFFGFVGIIFFVFPVTLSNIKLFGSKNKWINGLMFWVGLLIFDVIVAAMIAKNTDEIKSLLLGKESQLKFWEVVRHGEFWMIFMFGMIPLIITHYVINKLFNDYKNSQRDLVDAEKNRKIEFLDGEMIDLNSEKDKLANRVKEKEEIINQQNAKILNLESEINSLQTQIENRYSELQNQIKAIYDDFIARITSGKIFTDVIFGSVISAYKSGFIEFLPEYYATDEVANRVREIEQASKTTI